MVKKTKRKRAKRNTKKGGIFGIRALKTDWDNQRNWRKWQKDHVSEGIYQKYDPTWNYPSYPNIYGEKPGPKPTPESKPTPENKSEKVQEFSYT